MRHVLPALSVILLPFPAFAASTMTDGGISTTGTVNASNISLTTAGTTWGYISSTGSYLPNFSTNSISASSIRTSAPTATNDAATKAYVDTAVAAAGSTPQCVVTGSASTSSGTTAPACPGGFTEVWTKSGGQGCTTNSYESNLGGSNLNFFPPFYSGSDLNSQAVGVGTSLSCGGGGTTRIGCEPNGLKLLCYNYGGGSPSNNYWAFRVCCK